MESATSPTVRIALEAMRSHIRNGTYRAGGFLPPETELASTLGVSRGTIRRAIEVLVSTGEISKRAYSRPMIEARAMPPIATGTEIHVWISHPIADGATLQFLRGISWGLMGTNYRLVIREPNRFFGDYVKSEEREFLTDLLKNDNAVGAIIERDPWAECDDVYAKLIERGKHLVFVDIPAPVGLAADHVGTANLAAARQIVQHLQELGHSRILFVADSDLPPTNQERIKGYWRGMQQAGTTGLGQVIIANALPQYEGERMPVAGVFSRILPKGVKLQDWAQRAAREILAMETLPTAIFVNCDVMAYWVCAFLEGAGLSIPGDISVVGFDWLGRWEDPANDVLTTASQDFEGFGTHAADLLLDRITGDPYPAPRHVILPAPLVIRASTTADHSTAAAGAGPDSRVRPRYYR
jgi:LacI family transcriptional regulator, galactose operon repressor